MTLEEYLKLNYETVTKLKNGNYYVKTFDGTEVYVPSNIGEQTKLCGYLTGTNGVEEAAETVRTEMEGDNPPNYMVVISPKSVDANNMLNIGTQIIKDNNSKVSGIVIDSFGSGVNESIVNLDEWLKNHSDLAPVSTIVLKASEVEKFLADGTLKTNSTIIIVADNEEAMKANVKKLTEAGYNVAGIVKENDNGGVAKNLLGEGEATGYDYYKYDTKTGEYTKVGESAEGQESEEEKKKEEEEKEKQEEEEKKKQEEEEKKKKEEEEKKKQEEEKKKQEEEEKKKQEEEKSKKHSGSGGGGGSSGGKDTKKKEINVEELDPKSYTKVKKIQIKEEKSSVATAYKALKDLPTLTITHPTGKMKTDGIIADADFIVSSMNTIRTGISKSDFLSNLKTQAYRSGEGIPGIIMTKVNKYFDVVGDLLTMLEAESKSVVSIAQAWLYQDQDLAKEADGLGKAGKIETGESTYTPPVTTTSSDGVVYNSDPAIDAKIKAILADPNYPTKYVKVEPTRANFDKLRDDVKVICCIDCDTGDVYYNGAEVHIKKGEKKRLIVKLPTNNGNVLEIGRTTADACGHTDLVKTYSDIDPDPNNVEYVNICNKYSKHRPKNKELVKADHYDWVIETKNKSSNGKKFTMSQTTQYKTDVSINEYWKAMIDINFVIDN